MPHKNKIFSGPTDHFTVDQTCPVTMGPYRVLKSRGIKVLPSEQSRAASASNGSHSAFTKRFVQCVLLVTFFYCLVSATLGSNTGYKTIAGMQLEQQELSSITRGWRRAERGQERCRHVSGDNTGAHPAPDALFGLFAQNWPFCLCHQPGPSCTAPGLPFCSDTHSLGRCS